MNRTRLSALALEALVALVLIVAGCGGGTTTTTATPSTGVPSTAAPTTAGPTPSAPGAGADGAAIYAANCARCHGAAGEGGVGPDLRPLTADDTASVVEKIKTGADLMPPFAGTLTPEEIDAVAAYAVGLQ